MSELKTFCVKYTIDDEALVPFYATEEAAGCDLRSSVDTLVQAGCRELIPTGLKIEMPMGFEGQVRSRSGLAAKHGITVLNSPGTIDSDYRGEIKVILLNTSDQDFIINKGDRIAQLVFSQVFRGLFQPVEIISSTDRGDGGFGSTGKT
jgi:dUTP pyrophosphatase